MQENEVLISVPSSIKLDDVVYYQLIFSQKANSLLFSKNYRYSSLKKLFESLQTLKYHLPSFPESHWWKSTNNNRELIEQRRQQLDCFFQSLQLCPAVQKSLILKNFVLDAENTNQKRIEKEKLVLLKKEKSSSQFTTPVCKPEKEPLSDLEEAGSPYQFRLAKKKHRSLSHGYRQLSKVNVGGTNIFKGILTKVK